MAAKEMWDYLSASTADSTSTLTLVGQGNIQVKTIGTKNQTVHLADDNTEKRITYSSSGIFYLEIPYHNLTASEAGTIFDYWMSTSVGNGRGRSFRYAHHDGHSYTVRFDSDLDQMQKHGSLYNYSVRLKILGRGTST